MTSQLPCERKQAKYTRGTQGDANGGLARGAQPPRGRTARRSAARERTTNAPPSPPPPPPLFLSAFCLRCPCACTWLPSLWMKPTACRWRAPLRCTPRANGLLPRLKRKAQEQERGRQRVVFSSLLVPSLLPVCSAFAVFPVLLLLCRRRPLEKPKKGDAAAAEPGFPAQTARPRRHRTRRGTQYKHAQRKTGRGDTRRLRTWSAPQSQCYSHLRVPPPARGSLWAQRD